MLEKILQNISKLSISQCCVVIVPFAVVVIILGAISGFEISTPWFSVQQTTLGLENTIERFRNFNHIDASDEEKIRIRDDIKRLLEVIDPLPIHDDLHVNIMLTQFDPEHGQNDVFVCKGSWLAEQLGNSNFSLLRSLSSTNSSDDDKQNHFFGSQGRAEALDAKIIPCDHSISKGEDTDKLIIVGVNIYAQLILTDFDSSKIRYILRDTTVLMEGHLLSPIYDPTKLPYSDPDPQTTRLVEKIRKQLIEHLKEIIRKGNVVVR